MDRECGRVEIEIHRREAGANLDKIYFSIHIPDGMTSRLYHILDNVNRTILFLRKETEKTQKSVEKK